MVDTGALGPLECVCHRSMFLESLNSFCDVQKQNKSIKVAKYEQARICQYLPSESNLSDQT